MAEPKCLFDRLDDIAATQADILNEVIGVKKQNAETNARVVELEAELEKLRKEKAQPQNQQVYQQPRVSAPVREPTRVELFQQFIKQSMKCWRWLGNRTEFNKKKNLAIISLLMLLIVGVATTVVSSICFQLYSTFTLFENIWLIFGIIFLTYACRARLKYEVNDLAAHSPDSYEKDKLGMCFPKREKAVFKVFRIITIVAIACNIIAIWVMGHELRGLAAFMELLFLGAIIFSFFMNFNLFVQYSIIYIDGRNLTTNEEVTLVLPPGSNDFLLEEDFKKKMPYFFE